VEVEITRHGFATLPIILLLAACVNIGGNGAFGDKDALRNLPRGIDPNETGVDGLTVGHRLMAAGEYDLAERAYLRAGAEQGLNADVLSALGSANLKLNRLHQAEQLLRTAVGLDANFVPALNNLGVVLMERRNYGEARVFFQRAFAADSGETDSIRENLIAAIANAEDAVYAEPEAMSKFTLVRRGASTYELMSEL
jgi:Flp pilus assembly protein TadD